MAGYSAAAEVGLSNVLQGLCLPIEWSGHWTHYVCKVQNGEAQQAARALAVDPTVLLMDEPFAALDAQNRAMMQQEMIRILAEESKTVVLVTHSIEESINLSDVIIVMTRRPGRVKEIIRVPEPRRMVEDTPSYLEVRKRIRDLISDEHDLSDIA
jgi:NitT/TauT family transport system ATP-binding protein